MQWNKTRTKPQEKPKKIFEYIETEQHNAEWPVGHWRNKGRNQKVLSI
jgi:hypothetical protein